VAGRSTWSLDVIGERNLRTAPSAFAVVILFAQVGCSTEQDPVVLFKQDMDSFIGRPVSKLFEFPHFFGTKWQGPSPVMPGHLEQHLGVGNCKVAIVYHPKHLRLVAWRYLSDEKQCIKPAPRFHI
jgi:hypothetical protein